MKVDFKTLTRTSLGFPSEWEGKSTDNKKITISYRYGKTKIICDEATIATLTLDPFDVGGYMDDHVLEKLLKDNGFIE
jgi:Lhr-like helicase